VLWNWSASVDFRPEAFNIDVIHGKCSPVGHGSGRANAAELSI